MSKQQANDKSPAPQLHFLVAEKSSQMGFNPIVFLGDFLSAARPLAAEQFMRLDAKNQVCRFWDSRFELRGDQYGS